MTRINPTCPACSELMRVRRYQCLSCGTAVEGDFSCCSLCALTPDQREFVLAFLRVRGNIREMERELGVSYPTVRARLDAIVLSLGLATPERQSGAQDLLDQLERGELTVEQALARLKK